MKYWIETGVNGFVMNDVSHMVTDGSNLPELIEKLRTVVDQETDESGVPCVLIADDVSDPTVLEDPVCSIWSACKIVIERNYERCCHCTN